MSDLVPKNVQEIANVSEKYQSMIDKISFKLESIDRSNRIFYKPYSQFKNAVLDISNLSINDSLRHILAVIEQERTTLEQASIDIRRDEIKLKYMIKKNNDLPDGEEKELLELDIEEKQNHLNNSKNYILATIRKLTFMVHQYDKIMSKIDNNDLTEEEFEISEIRTHIIKAFSQALNSARSRGGVIDEGNQIYLSQLGINGCVAQQEISDFIKLELDMLENGKMPTQIMVLEWLELLADKYMKYSKELTSYRGLDIMDQDSLVD